MKISAIVLFSFLLSNCIFAANLDDFRTPDLRFIKDAVSTFNLSFKGLSLERVTTSKKIGTGSYLSRKLFQRTSKDFSSVQIRSSTTSTINRSLKQFSNSEKGLCNQVREALVLNVEERLKECVSLLKQIARAMSFLSGSGHWLVEFKGLQGEVFAGAAYLRSSLDPKEWMLLKFQ